MLPQNIGAKVQIPAGDLALWRYTTWHGFVPEHGSPQGYVMRRDFRSGIHGCFDSRGEIVGVPEPYCPAASRGRLRDLEQQGVPLVRL